MKCIIVSLNGADNSGGVERVVFYLNKILYNQYEIKILKRKVKLGSLDKIIYPLLFSFLLLFKKNNLIISNSWQSFLAKADFSIHHGTTAGYMKHAGIKSNKSAFLAWMEKISAKRAKKILAVSRNCKDELINIYGIKPEKIIVLNNFVDETLFYPKSIFHNETKTIILFSGRLEERKGLNALLNLAQYIENSCEFFLKIASNSEDNISQFKRFKNTQILSGLDIDEMRNFYNSGDVLYFPSKYEGFSMATLEALACGLPVIGSSFAIPEEIRHYDFCCLENSTDPEIILPIIKSLKSSFTNKRDSIYNTIRKDFGFNQYKEKLCTLFT